MLQVDVPEEATPRNFNAHETADYHMFGADSVRRFARVRI